MAQIALPNTLTNGTVADATQVMANFNSIVDVVNGNLGADNLGSITGTDVTVTDINGGSNALNNFTQRFQAGSVQFNNIPANDYSSIVVPFPVSYPGLPLIFTSLNTQEPKYWFNSADDITATDFRFRVRQDNTDGTTRSVTGYWMAVYIGAFA